MNTYQAGNPDLNSHGLTGAIRRHHGLGAQVSSQYPGDLTAEALAGLDAHVKMERDHHMANMALQQQMMNGPGAGILGGVAPQRPPTALESIQRRLLNGNAQLMDAIERLDSVLRRVTGATTLPPKDTPSPVQHVTSTVPALDAIDIELTCSEHRLSALTVIVGEIERLG